MGFGHVLIVGGGASGMAAALWLSYQNKKISVTILEKNDRIGKKLLLTGNGRCNLSHVPCGPSSFHGEAPDFTVKTLQSFPPDKIAAFFSRLGVDCVFESGGGYPGGGSGKLFPRSLHASSVLDAMRLALKESGVDVKCGCRCTHIKKRGDSFFVSCENGEKWEGDAVLIATGGICAPGTGSDGDGYRFLEHFSHKLVVPVPAIVQLVTKDSFCKSVSGLKISGECTLYLDKIPVRGEKGEILFTDYGISGPPVLQLSGYVSRALYRDDSKPKPELLVDFLPDISTDHLKSMLIYRRENFSKRSLEYFFTGLFHKRIGTALLKKILNINLSHPSGTLTDANIDRLADGCKSQAFSILDTMGFDRAQVTAGGISTEMFSDMTMESCLCRGLFACGEVLDIDGDCGGFNLHWAWSSAFIAAEGILAEIKEARIS